MRQADRNSKHRSKGTPARIFPIKCRINFLATTAPDVLIVGPYHKCVGQEKMRATEGH